LASPAAAQTVPLPHFDSIQLNGGGRVELRQGPVQRVTLRSGSTAFTDIRVEPRYRERRLVIDACNRRCPHLYRLEIVIETPDARALAIAGGGEIVSGAFAPQRDVAVSVRGGGRIDLRAAPARSVAASVEGGGAILVNPRDSLAASVEGGGEIVYWGNPSVARSIQGGGSVRQGR
jgi:hypothetical protein